MMILDNYTDEDNILQLLDVLEAFSDIPNFNYQSTSIVSYLLLFLDKIKIKNVQNKIMSIFCKLVLSMGKNFSFFFTSINLAMKKHNITNDNFINLNKLILADSLSNIRSMQSDQKINYNRIDSLKKYDINVKQLLSFGNLEYCETDVLLIY